MSPPPPCSICTTPMIADVLPETYRCPTCGYFSSGFAVTINESGSALDEDRRMDALSAIRHENFAEMLEQLTGTKGFPAKGTILDIGCGHGWFLDALKERGYDCAGVEPDTAIAEIARSHGHEVMPGFFPAALPAHARFEAAFFNDVFEHLPDVGGVIEDVKRHTGDDGWVIVNLPVSDGIIFRLARLLARLGLSGPYRRLWQHGLPSPHLSYFSSRNLEQLFAGHGFHLAASGTLRSVSYTGLLARIRYDRAIGPLMACIYYAAAVLMVPALAVLPGDIRFFAFRKTSSR